MNKKFLAVWCLMASLAHAEPFVFTGEVLKDSEAIEPVKKLTVEEFPAFLEKNGVKVYMLTGKNNAIDKNVQKAFADNEARLGAKPGEGVTEGMFINKDNFQTEFGKKLPKQLQGQDLLIMRPGLSREHWIHEWLHVAMARGDHSQSLWSRGGQSKQRFFADTESAFERQFQVYKKKYLKTKVSPGKEYLTFGMDRTEATLYALEMMMGEELDILRYQYEKRKELGENSFSPKMAEVARGYLAQTYAKFQRLMEDIAPTCKDIRGPDPTKVDKGNPFIKRCDVLTGEFYKVGDKIDAYRKLNWD